MLATLAKQFQNKTTLAEDCVKVRAKLQQVEDEQKDCFKNKNNTTKECKIKFLHSMASK